MTRFKLRTLIILTALLPAAFGMLWRCGQIDGEIHEGGGSVRVGSHALVWFPGGVSLAHAVQWGIIRPQHNYVLVINGKEILPAMQYTECRPDHPWNGRHWEPVYEYERIIDWSDQ